MTVGRTVTIVDVETRTGWVYLTDTARVIVDRQPYQPRLEATDGYVRHQFQPGATLGAGESEAKPIPLTNADRALVSLHRAVDGRRIIIRHGELDADGRPPRTMSAYSIGFQGRVETVDFDGDVASLRILSRQKVIAEALVTEERFDGTATSGDAGLGGNVDLAGKPLPVLVGYAYNFAPPPANPFKGIYRVSRGWQGHSVSFDWVRDRGAEIVAGTQQASVAALQAASPAPGTYDWYTGDDGTLIYPGSIPEGLITCAATEGGGRTAAEVAQWLLEQSAEVSAGSVNGVDAMNSAVPGESGIWIGAADRAIGSALEEVLNGVGSWVDDLNDLSLTLYAWGMPSESVQAIADWETLDDVDLLSSGDVGGGSPIRQVLVGYRRNYSPLDPSDVHFTVANDVAGELIADFLVTTPAEAEGWEARNPLAQTMRLDTNFKNLADAERIRDRHRDLRANGVDLYRWPLPTSRVTADIGRGVTVTSSRFPLSAAQCGVLGRDTIGRTVDGISVTDLIIWRPTP